MSKLLDELTSMGCDMDSTMERFMNDEEFYVDCFKQLLEDEEFAKLKEQLTAHNVKEAFDCAHTLKGVCANMGLKSMYDIIVQMVEPLRAGNDENLLDIYDNLMAEKEKYDNLVKTL